MFDDDVITPSAPGLFSIELFCAWIDKLMVIYDKDSSNTDIFGSENKKYSKAYYSKKVN